MIGRLLRAKMRDDARETPERAEERKRHYAVCKQVQEESLARFGPITAENAAEAIRWSEQRIQELLKCPSSQT